MGYTAEQFAKKAAELSIEAAKAGTFGVGGLLIDSSGNILTTMKNGVIENGRVVDPTAHVERQTVDWYFEQRNKGVELPEPHELTIISTLDPCVMCTGAISIAGINVVTMAKDEFAGINWNWKHDFRAVPEDVRASLFSQFSYFGVEGEQGFIGFPKAPFTENPIISKETSQIAVGAFSNNLDAIRDSINTMSEGVSVNIERFSHFTPSDLASALYNLAENSSKIGASFNAAALITNDHKLLLATGGGEHLSPIQTPMVLLMRGYSAMRAEDPSLPHPKDCITVMHKGPGADANGLLDLGAFGSTMEGPVGINDNLRYVVPTQSQEDLDQMVKNLPPLYNEFVNISPKQWKLG